MKTRDASRPLSQNKHLLKWVEKIAQLTKPAGALGDLEDLGVRLAGVFGSERPHPRGVAVLVAAGDHGVASSGVSAYPPEVTPAMGCSRAL